MLPFFKRGANEIKFIELLNFTTHFLDILIKMKQLELIPNI